MIFPFDEKILKNQNRFLFTVERQIEFADRIVKEEADMRIRSSLEDYFKLVREGANVEYMKSFVLGTHLGTRYYYPPAIVGPIEFERSAPAICLYMIYQHYLLKNEPPVR